MGKIQPPFISSDRTAAKIPFLTKKKAGGKKGRKEKKKKKIMKPISYGTGKMHFG